MQIPSTLGIWLQEQSVPLLILLAFLAFVFLALVLSARARQKRMLATRVGVSEDTFVESLALFGFDPFIARTTFRYLQDNQRVSFPVHASDQLDEDLGLGASEVDESVRDLLKLCERLYQPGLRHQPLITVEDLVRFIQASPRLSQLAA